MKRYNKFLWTMVLALILLCCSGCGIQLVSPENLVQAPKSNQEQLQQRQEILSFLNRDENLIIPETGTQGSAYQIVDLDNDGVEEIVAFYNNKDNTFQLGFLILDRINDEYHLRNKEIMYGRGIHSFSTVDLDGNGSKELLIGIRTGYGTQKELSVYQMTPDDVIDITQDEHLAYDQMNIAKTSTGENVLVLANMDTASLVSTSEISVYSYQNLLLYPVFGASYDGYCNEIAYGNLTSQQYGILLSLRGNHSVRVLALEEFPGGYQMILDESLPMDYEDLGNQKLFRDVNRDNLLEIVAICTPEENNTGKGPSEFLQIWMQCDGEGGSKLVGSVMNAESDGYTLQIPTEWLNNFYYSLRTDNYGNWIDFYVPDVNDTYVVAFSLGAIDQLAWTANPLEQAAILGNNPQKNKIYAAILSEDELKDMKVDVSTLISCLNIEGGEHK